MREKPLIIMGDFNCQWRGKKSPLRTMATELELTAWRPEAKDLRTFKKLKRRFDWILIQKSKLEFISYKVLSDVVSDHKPVLAEIKVRDFAAPP